MATKKRDDLKGQRESHKAAIERVLSLDPQTHPADWREAFRDYVRTTDAVTANVLGDDEKE